MDPYYIIEVYLDQERRGPILDWVSAMFQGRGLLGVEEGDVASEGVAQVAFDEGVADPGRDWVGTADWLWSRIFMASATSASEVKEALRTKFDLTERTLRGPLVKESEDWLAKWKVGFKKFSVPPFWTVVPEWEQVPTYLSSLRMIRINPGAGFGTGTHETTALCLERIGEAGRKEGEGAAFLDFGAGSGILSIGARKMGYERILAVEVDPLAIENANHNEALNFSEPKILWHQAGRPPGGLRFSFVVANILKNVLCREADALVRCCEAGGTLLLSGVLREEVGQVREHFEGVMQMRRKKTLGPALIVERGEWAALQWKFSDS